MSGPKKVRLKLETDVTTLERMQALQNALEATSLVAVIRVALHLLEVSLECRKQGGTLVLRAADGSEQEVELRAPNPA